MAVNTVGKTYKVLSKGEAEVFDNSAVWQRFTRWDNAGFDNDGNEWFDVEVEAGMESAFERLLDTDSAVISYREME